MSVTQAATGTPVDMSLSELKGHLDAGSDLFVVDVRNRDEFAAWRLESRGSLPTINVPYFEIIEEGMTLLENGAQKSGDGSEDDVVESIVAYARKHWRDVLPTDKTILTVCAHGGTSDLVARALRSLGYTAVNLAAGMAAWGDFYDVRSVTLDDGTQIFQVNRPARGCLSYVVASDGEAVVIDPLRHIEHYTRLAEEHGLRITRVLDTHGHADHISGGVALARQLGVPYHLHPYDAIHPLDVLPATIAYEPLHDGQEFRFGRATMRAVHVPGHTLGNIVFVLNDAVAFTGDSIFIESVARPDLGGRGETWAPLHYRSLRRLLDLPGDTIIMPGHFSSPAEADERGLYARTLAELLETNEGLRMVERGEEAFVAYLLGSLPRFPEQYVDIKRVNAGLLQPDEDTASELELGRNICALSQAYKE